MIQLRGAFLGGRDFGMFRTAVIVRIVVVGEKFLGGGFGERGLS